MSQKSDNAKPSSERLVKTFAGRRADNIPPKRNSASSWTAFAASTASRNCACCAEGIAESRD